MREIILENQWLRAVVLPDVGAKIYDLLWKPSNRSLLWHNPRTPPQSYAIEGIFDNYWCGGWDDCFPTCDACEYRGEQYPSLGELRSLHWNVDAATETSATLSTYTPISPARAIKTVTLDRDAPVLGVRHRITNIGPRPLDFIWGTHPALNVSAGDLLRIPARSASVGEASCTDFGVSGQQYQWPLLPSVSGSTDMSRVQAAAKGEFCGHYALDLEAGWYTVESAAGGGFLLRFPLELCPVLWLWLNYGGYRGHHHVIVEPWTSRPLDLAAAAKQGTSRRLETGASFEIELAATAWDAPETFGDALKRAMGGIEC